MITETLFFGEKKLKEFNKADILFLNQNNLYILLLRTQLMSDKEYINLKKRLEDLYRQSYTNNSYIFSRFLSSSDAAAAYEVADKDTVRLWGGAEGCERVMIRFGDAASLGYEVDFPISTLKIRPVNPKYCEELTHRDYLGVFMSLGVERDTIGDIVIKDKNAYAFVCDSIAEHLCKNIESIKNTTVICAKCDPENESGISIEPEFDEKMIIVPSPRIDAVIAKLYNLSRSESRRLFTAGMVLVNGRSCGNESLVPKERDIFAVRGYGKFIFEGVGEMTRKGNVMVRINRYV